MYDPVRIGGIEEIIHEWPKDQNKLDSDLILCINDAIKIYISEYNGKTPLQIKLLKRVTKNKFHWPHWRRYDMDGKYTNAFNLAIKSGKIGDIKFDFTVELMGKKFQACPAEDSKLNEYGPHGSIRLEIPPELRTAEGLRKICKNMPWCEGIVIHCKNGKCI